MNRVAGNLRRERFISGELYFALYVWERGLGGALQAGDYSLRSGMSPKEIADMMAAGNVFRDTVTITIPEGFTVSDSDAVLQKADFFGGERKGLADFTVKEFSEQYDFLRDAPQDATLEGYVFPDTYYFERGATARAVAQRMLDNFGKKLDTGLREEIRRQGKRVFDVVVMASLLEKEVITETDMRIVSGILWKRIALGMPLQVDATVLYATGRSDLTTADLAVDSLYNTYRYKGLPKGPISNPGLQALRAAAYPTESEYLFYLSKPNKETVFSKTLREHNIAKERYLK